MGTYNTAREEMSCPRCGVSGRVEVELHLGLTHQMVTVEIGDPYPFAQGREPRNGGAVEGVVEDGGYTECSGCGRDFFCAVEIRDGRMVALRPSLRTPPYGPDRVATGAASCPSCASDETRHFEYDGLLIGWLLCDAEGCNDRVVTELDEAAGAYRTQGADVPRHPGGSA
ncbi:MAG: hypothetical protein AAF533_21085 [Acidobacteriota bacterium]